MIINTITDLRNYIDNGDYGTTAPWADVRDEVAEMIREHENCPTYGDDWTEFLGTFNFSELVIEADETVMAQEVA